MDKDIQKTFTAVDENIRKFIDEKQKENKIVIDKINSNIFELQYEISELKSKLDSSPKTKDIEHLFS